MARKKKLTIGSWAFLIGVILAVIFGWIGLGTTIAGVNTTIAWVLVIIGIIVGLLNIAAKEVQSFLLAGTVLVIVSNFGGDIFSVLGSIEGVFNALLFMFVPATVIVALKHVFSLAKS